MAKAANKINNLAGFILCILPSFIRNKLLIRALSVPHRGVFVIHFLPITRGSVLEGPDWCFTFTLPTKRATATPPFLQIPVVAWRQPATYSGDFSSTFRQI
jgi:hypothetical protein